MGSALDYDNRRVILQLSLGPISCCRQDGRGEFADRKAAVFERRTLDAVDSKNSPVAAGLTEAVGIHDELVAGVHAVAVLGEVLLFEQGERKLPDFQRVETAVAAADRGRRMPGPCIG